MTKQKSLKKSLAKSAVAMTLCAGMLIGSTYAWFSDEAKTQDVTITAGNLDVEIVKEDGNQPFTGESIFREMEGDNFLWEPGAMWVSDTFKIKNLGNLALWYSLSLEAEETTESGDVNLLKAIKMKVVNMETMSGQVPDTSEDTDLQKRQTFWDAITSNEAEVSTGTLNVKDETSPSLAVVLYWEPTDSVEVDPSKNADNKYNISADKYEQQKLSAKFHLNVFATQTPKEEDDFGKNYDKDAKDSVVVANAVKEAVAGAQDVINKALEDSYPDLVDTIKVSPLTKDEYGAYTTTFDFSGLKEKPANTAQALLAGYNAMKEAVAEALLKQKDNISEVKINGTKVEGLDTAEDKTQLGTALENALKEAYKLEELEGGKLTIPVVVTDKGGVNTTYKLTFDLSALVDG